MKIGILIVLIAGLMMISHGSLAVNYEKETFVMEIQEGAITLITEWGGGRIIIIDHDGNIIWNITGLSNPQDAERLSNGNTLIVEYATGRVFELDSDNIKVWQKGGLGLPVDAERLENGNTLITEFSTQRVIEVDNEYNIVWEKTNLSSPFDAERLENGNTLIAESFPEGQVIEVNSDGNIVWQVTDLEGPIDIERLSNGNTLITEHIGKRVSVFDDNGTIVWQKSGLLAPKDAEELPNGNILIAECGANRTIEVDSSGSNVWIKSGLQYPVDVERYYNHPPSIEILNPKDGYLHFSGIPVFPTYINILANTLSFGGFRLNPIIINATDDFDKSEDILVNVYLNGEYQGNASYCCDWRKHEWFWTGWALGTYNLNVTAEDSFGAINSTEMNVWNFCFIP
jgi:hypothetical protein